MPKMATKKIIILLVITIVSAVLIAPFAILFESQKRRTYLHKELIYKVIVSKSTEGLKTDREKALELLRYVHSHIFVNFPPGLDEVVIDHPLHDLILGIVGCDGMANTLIRLARKAGIKGRLIFLRGYDSSSHHSVCDLYVDGEFKIFDPTFGAVFLDNEGNLASFDDMQKRTDEFKPFYVTNTMQGARRFDNKRYMYFRLYEPKHEPEYFRTNFEQNLKRFILSRSVDIYYNIFRDLFLVLHQELYFKLSNLDPFYAARLSHLSSRYESAIIDYDYLINNSKDEFTRMESRFFKALAFWDMGDHKRSILEFEELLTKDPNTPRLQIVLLYIIDSCGRIGDMDRRQFYVSKYRAEINIFIE